MIATVIIERYKAGESFALPDGAVALSVVADPEDMDWVTVTYLLPG